MGLGLCKFRIWVNSRFDLVAFFVIDSMLFLLVSCQMSVRCFHVVYSHVTEGSR